jgi:WD40 repeat protein
VLLSVGLLTAAGAIGWSSGRPAGGSVRHAAAGPPPPAVDLFGDPLPGGAVARMGSTRLRHAGMSDYVWLSDSKTVLTSGGDRALRFWDAATGKEKRNVPLQGKSGPGRLFTLSPDGKVLAALEKGSLLFWEVETGKHVKTLPAPKGRLTFLWFSPDGKTLAVGREDLRMSLWDWRAGKEREVRLAHRERRFFEFRSDSSTHGSFSPDGKWFVAGAHSQEPLGVFEVGTGREARRIDCHASVSAVSPDSKTIAVCSHLNDKGARGTVIRLFDLATGKQRKQFSLGGEDSFYSLAFSPEGKKLACGLSDSSRVLDCATGRVLYRLPDRPLALSFSPDGKTLAASTGNRLRFWDAATGKERLTLPEGLGFTPAIAVSPDGKVLAAGDWMDQAVSVWDASTGRLLRRLPLKGEKRYVRNVAFSGDGKTLVACQGMGFLQFWDVTTGKERRSLQLTDPSHPNKDHMYFYQLQLSADGKHLSTLERVLRDESTRVGVWELATGKLLHRQFVREKVLQGAWSADGKTVALSRSADLKLQDVETGDVRSLASGGPYSPPLASPDGRLLAAVERKGTVRVYERASGKLVTTLTHSPRHLCLAPDDRTLVTCDERSIRVWDLATGKERHSYRVPATAADLSRGNFVLALALSPDARRAFTVLADGTALVWDLSPALRPAAPPGKAPGDRELAAWWADLASDDAGRAHAAVWRLAEAPAAAAHIRKRLRPASAEEIKKIGKLIEELDSDTFAVRDKATKQLEALGGDIATVLQEALSRKQPLEVKQRLERLLKQARKKGLSSEALRSWRAIQALELNASSEARRVLTDLSDGAAHAERTQQAKAALTRLSRKTGKR